MIDTSATTVSEAVFAAPATRMLMAGDGRTTLVLEALVRDRLHLRISHQESRTAAALPAAVVDPFDIGADDRVLVRWSSLRTSDDRVVSRNYVVAPADDAAALGLDSTTVPIGHGLGARRVAQRRRITRVGLSRWSDNRPCAARCYLMLIDGRVVSYIRECFNPAEISAELAPGTAALPESWDDEPHGPAVAGPDHGLPA